MKTTIKDLTVGDFFYVISEPNNARNIYKLLSPELMPNIAGSECGNSLYEFNTEEEVEKVDGFALYLLNGGRDWD